jgi:hypothetical protein
MDVAFALERPGPASERYSKRVNPKRLLGLLELNVRY